MAAIIALLTTLVAQLDKLAKHMSRPRQHILCGISKVTV